MRSFFLSRSIPCFHPPVTFLFLYTTPGESAKNCSICLPRCWLFLPSSLILRMPAISSFLPTLSGGFRSIQLFRFLHFLFRTDDSCPYTLKFSLPLRHTPPGFVTAKSRLPLSTPPTANPFSALRRMIPQMIGLCISPRQAVCLRCDRS